MVWLPDWKWKQQQQAKGKGCAGGSWSKPAWTPKWDGGKGKWGKGGKKKSSVDPKRTVWIGGLPEGATFQDLKAHGEQAGTAKWAEVYKNKGKGTGAIGYASAEDAAGAVSLLNGSVFQGATLHVDTWVRQKK
mmetsp:Transcript_23168/g.44481  ORF Transcript_23168/g.44481 Transcript_23168/m.44481 type:complete len:133 (-) Transcript_23168:72-470(-)